MKPSTFGWGSRNLALGALGLNVLVVGALTLTVLAIEVVPDAIVVETHALSTTLARWTSLARWIGALGFLPWLHHAYKRALVVAPSPALQEEHRKGPVVGFFIPILSFFRPYRAVRVLDEALDPEQVPLPPTRLEDGTGTYREPARLAAIDRRPAPPAPVALWWSLWIGGMLTGVVNRIAKPSSNLSIAGLDAITFGAAIAACVVVLRITARLEEVERRTEALKA